MMVPLLSLCHPHQADITLRKMTYLSVMTISNYNGTGTYEISAIATSEMT